MEAYWHRASPPDTTGEAYRAEYAEVGKAHHIGESLDGSTQPGKATHPGQVGPEQPEPTSLRAIANRVCPETDTACAEARATEEPDAGKLHVRDCTGGAG